ncbi:GNAT family N-acetyltransferase [Kerstersia gyiorum]|uniref:GNAT family N-acetyltransferase n=1 Tax=Kerstersia gyiorum TaxID=206506 RepID=UPI000A036787|nr:GNAT family N-acetyltransferase [Kerstersia gyiorum]AZV95618.1 hypothetical protein CBF45_14225 [Bordetella sp. J329]MCR4157298.1 GNAT family N-acetyltransferase [Kerstersia gyiorum]
MFNPYAVCAGTSGKNAFNPGLYVGAVLNLGAGQSQDNLVGFLNAEVLNHELHIWELSVHGDWQRQGVGTGLLRSAYQYAVETGLAALTLTTFKDVPWCAPAYAKFGFKPVMNPVLHLRDALNAEAAHGLPVERRVAMRLPITRPEQ